MVKIGYAYRRFLSNGEEVGRVVIDESNVDYHNDLLNSGVRYEVVPRVFYARKPLEECEACSA